MVVGFVIINWADKALLGGIIADRTSLRLGAVHHVGPLVTDLASGAARAGVRVAGRGVVSSSARKGFDEVAGRYRRT